MTPNYLGDMIQITYKRRRKRGSKFVPRHLHRFAEGDCCSSTHLLTCSTRVFASVLVVWMAKLIEAAEKLNPLRPHFFTSPCFLRPLLAVKRERA